MRRGTASQFLAIPRSEGRAEQRVFTLPQATLRKVQAWLRHLNARDYDIYLCVNPIRLRSGGQDPGTRSGAGEERSSPGPGTGGIW